MRDRHHMPVTSASKGFRSAALARNFKFALPALAVLILLLCPPSHGESRAAPAEFSGMQLLMIEDPGCPYCARWHEEVGIAYAASDEGQFAPLVRRRRNDPDVGKFQNVVYSPTFIIVREGVEIGRIVGYPGADFFWGLLSAILQKAGFRANGFQSEAAPLESPGRER